MNSPSGSPPHAAALSPAQRLEDSRARLRKAWIGEPREDEEVGPPDPREHGSLLYRIGELLARGWARHPLKAQLDTALEVMGPAARSTLGPLVQRHPLRLLAFAVGLGALTIWLRPWRWLPRAALGSALLSALLPRQAILSWITSGRWLEVLRSDHLEAWFGRSNHSHAAAEDTGAAMPTNATTAGPQTATPASATPASAAAPIVSAPVPSSEERASYGARAPAPIAAENAHP